MDCPSQSIRRWGPVSQAAPEPALTIPEQPCRNSQGWNGWSIMQKVLWFLAGAIAVVVVVAAGGLIFLKTRGNGFSARAQPSGFEEFAAQTARGMALPPGAKDKRNPIANSSEVLGEARVHWADHCALCHANDGSGENTM